MNKTINLTNLKHLQQGIFFNLIKINIIIIFLFYVFFRITEKLRL